MGKRILAALCAMVCGAVWAAGAGAAGNAGSTFVETETVSATLSAATCEALTTDVTVTGTARTVAHLSFDAAGIGRLAGVTAISGTGVGTDGSTYRFSYHGSFSGTFTGFPATIWVTDHFTLVGSGGANRVLTFFTAFFVIGSFEEGDLLDFDAHVVIGDPFFCDPL